jgi:hypothetical protein
VFQSENIDFDEIGLLHLLTIIAKTDVDIAESYWDYANFVKYDFHYSEKYDEQKIPRSKLQEFNFVECRDYADFVKYDFDWYDRKKNSKLQEFSFVECVSYSS